MTTHLALQVSLVGAQVGVQYVKEEPTMTSRWTFQSYEDKLDLDEFLDWLQTMERAFDYKDIFYHKRIKLIALKLRKYASTWWANVLSKGAKKDKGMISNGGR